MMGFLLRCKSLFLHTSAVRAGSGASPESTRGIWVAAAQPPVAFDPRRSSSGRVPCNVATQLLVCDWRDRNATQASLSEALLQ
jgi:hypothetical protein